MDNLDDWNAPHSDNQEPYTNLISSGQALKAILKVLGFMIFVLIIFGVLSYG